MRGEQDRAGEGSLSATLREGPPPVPTLAALGQTQLVAPAPNLKGTGWAGAAHSPHMPLTLG